MTTTSAASTEDVFEDVLNLEDQYYREGYSLGVADGSQSGRIEGRIFGLEKGFEKFLEMGKLNGRAAVWEARLASSPENHKQVIPSDEEESNQMSSGSRKGNHHDRLRKHVERLAALSDPEDLSTKNSEDDVSEFDDRLKDAKAKATLIARIIGEDGGDVYAKDDDDGGEVQDGDGGRGKPLRVRRNRAENNAVAGRKTGEMEDFLGLPSRT